MSRRPPEQKAIYFLDENVDGPLLAEALRAEGLEVRQHRECFAQGAEDERWIPTVAASGWVIVTRDIAIKRRPAERTAWIAANAVVVMIRSEQPLSAADMAATLIRIRARLENYISKRIPPMIIFVRPDGDIELKEGGERRGGKQKP
jgi:hypothetical protein